MEKKQIILEATADGTTVEKLTKINLNVDLDLGIIQISGIGIVTSLSGKEMPMIVPVDVYNIRLAEMEKIPDLTKLQTTKIAIFTDLLNTIKNATETAVKAIYTLNNE